MPQCKDSKSAEIIQAAIEVITIEANAVLNLRKHINLDFVNACEHIINCNGRVVTTGMGKSGHIAKKVAATLASTGTPAMFVHPGEASHGDLGMITKDDVVLAFSYSGTTQEIVFILPLIKRLQVALISLTGNKNSILATAADIHLDVSVATEACPLGLAPTASTTAALAMGDALAVAALKARGFTSEDFARSHPGGKLGRKLLLTINDVMHKGTDIPIVTNNATVDLAIIEISQKRLGMTTIIDQNSKKILGIFTDGDLRRALDNKIELTATAITEVMSSAFQTITSDELAATAVTIMETNKITALPVVDDKNRVIGALNIHDLFKAGVV